MKQLSAFISLCILTLILAVPLMFPATVTALQTAPTGGQTVGTTVTPTVSVLPVVKPGIPKDQAQRNSLYFIGIMTLAMGILVAVGYWQKSSTGKTPEMVWVLLLALTVFNLVILSRPLQVEAFCPVCTIAVGAGLGIAKSLGIDDVITSIWIGGLMVSMTMWLINWLDSKHIRFLFRKPLVVLVMYGMLLIPFIATKVIGSTGNTLWGIDKIVLGMIIGTIGFIGGYLINGRLLKKNRGHVFFPFQKVVLPIMAMIILSLVFYFIVY